MVQSSKTGPKWVEGSLKLSGIDNRMIALLKSIAHCGSISQAAKQCGLSYKGAWQIIERANNSAPRILISTAAGGSKGGGTCLTEAGKCLLTLFTELETRHNRFIEKLNHDLAASADALLLLKHLAVKTSVRNQLFGTISAIAAGALSAQVYVDLAGGDRVISAISLETINELGLATGTDAVLLINSTDIALAPISRSINFSASNRLVSTVIRIQGDEINSEVSLLLSGGEIITSVITTQSLQKMMLTEGLSVLAIFKANAPILGVL